MKKIPLVLLAVVFFATLDVGAETGESLFRALGCTSCHRAEKSSSINPSLVDIARAYQGKDQQLMGYLNGQGDAIVKPEKAAMMKRFVEKTKTLEEPERAALAAFILGHQR